MKDPDHMEDAELLQLSATGDAEAFGTWARRHSGFLLSLLRRFGLDATEAEDTAQQTLLQAYQAAGRYDAGRSSPRSWVSTIALNLARNHVRGRARFHVAREALAAEPRLRAVGQEDTIDEERRREQVRGAIASLPEEQRAVLLLRLDGELGFAAIGEQLGISPAAAKQRFHRATQTLRKELTP